MEVKTYGIRAGYRANDKAQSADVCDDELYWNEKRVHAARFYQYGVYRYAMDLIERFGLKSILDVGCGVGIKLGLIHARFPDVRIVGVDQEEAITICRQRNSFGEWFVDDIEQPLATLPGLTADLVISADVIEHMVDPDYLLSYAQKHSRPGGLLLVSTPDREALHGPDCLQPTNREHIREWSFEEFSTYLESRGLEVVEHVRQFPVRFGFHAAFLHEIVRRWFKGRPLKFNQVCLARFR